MGAYGKEIMMYESVGNGGASFANGFIGHQDDRGE
jgi:hypothetical protein